MEATAPGASPAPTFAAAVGELFDSTRSLIADEVDLVAAEAHAALRTLIAMVIVAVSAAVLFVCAAGALLGIGVVALVAQGLSPQLAFGVLALTCLAGGLLLLLALRHLGRRTLFAASRRELRGRS